MINKHIANLATSRTLGLVYTQACDGLGLWSVIMNADNLHTDTNEKITNHRFHVSDEIRLLLMWAVFASLFNKIQIHKCFNYERISYWQSMFTFKTLIVDVKSGWAPRFSSSSHGDIGGINPMFWLQIPCINPVHAFRDNMKQCRSFIHRRKQVKHLQVGK
jgi:hypothetical protein